jgi:hypothetical protein
MPDSREELRALMLAFQKDAELFVRRVLGVTPTPQQSKLLKAISQPGARVSVKSGHGTGKTTVLAWVVLWHVSCFPDSKTPCTAPTGHQLNDLLWAEIAKWQKKAHPFFRDALTWSKDSLAVKGNEQGQFAVARTSRKENPEALQGFHATNVLYVVDEASGVPDPIFEPMRGALSTAGARVVLAANPTRLDGLFHRTHHRLRDSWQRLTFSCLDSPMVSPEYIEEMKRDYGEDSDIYRVRVLGEFPNQSINQLIGRELVDKAMKRHLRADQYTHAPIVLGVDVAWEGDDCSVVYLRQGLYSKQLGRFNGIDNMSLADRVISWQIEHQAQNVFIDVGWGTGVIDRMRQLGHSPTPVNFGGKATKVARYQNKRSEMWVELKEWLENGGVLEDEEALAEELCAPEYMFTPAGKIQLEAKKDIKKRGLPSPDRADALALTFAAPVVSKKPVIVDRAERRFNNSSFTNHKYDPLSR